MLLSIGQVSIWGYFILEKSTVCSLLGHLRNYIDYYDMKPCALYTKRTFKCFYCLTKHGE